MPRRNPTSWLMTDERLGALAPVLRRLPPGTGVVFRHHAAPPRERRLLLRQAERIAQARRLLLVAAGRGARHGVHGAAPASGGLRTWPAHDRREAIAGRRAGATLLFVSPVFATRSHPRARPLGARRAAHIGRNLGADVVALGGMDARRWRRLRHLGFHGWAAIDAWIAPAPKVVLDNPLPFVLSLSKDVSSWRPCFDRLSTNGEE